MALDRCAGSGAPNTAVPATNTVAPAAAQRAAVSASIPPSTSSGGVRADQLAQALELARASVSRNAWPPQPGLTVMHRTMSGFDLGDRVGGRARVERDAASGSPRRVIACNA